MAELLVHEAGAAWPTLSEPERSTLREVLIQGPVSRVEIARKLGVSRSSLTRVTRRLLELGLVVEGDSELRARTGRPSEMLHVNAAAHTFVGFKLTGSEVFAVVTDMRATVLYSRSASLTDRTVDGVIEQLAQMLEDVRADGYAPTALGVALAGDVIRVDGREIISDSSYLGWDEVPLGDLLSSRVGLPVAVQNDVKALTATEHWFGAGAGHADLAVITVGVGLGFGFVTNDSLVTGANGHAGRVDHLLIDPSGPICDAGHRGCASVFATNDAIVRAIGVVGLDYDGAVALAREGNRAALRAFSDAGRALGMVIGTVANALDPSKIILTGDGIAVVNFAHREITESIAFARLHAPHKTPLDIQPFEFTEWARGGAVAAIRALVSP